MAGARPPGVGETPPSDWPAPKLDGPLPGDGIPDHRPRALVGFVAFLVGALVVGLAFGAYVLGERDNSDPQTLSPGPGIDVGGVLDMTQTSVVTLETRRTGTSLGGTGSGVIIGSDGLIVTNAHVISGADTITVRLHDGSEIPATVVGASAEDDLALVQVERNGLPPMRLGSSADLEVGDDVLAIGNALGLGGDHSVTRGIVSAKGRAITDGVITLHHLIQTDAAINQGNSGGALVNARGELIGINTALVSGAQNVGFAVAIDRVKELLPQLEAGEITEQEPHAVLGVVGVTVDGDLSEQTRERFGVVSEAGSLVVEVAPESAAEAAGFIAGDVIVEIDGEEIASNTQVSTMIREREPGERVMITVEREGRRRSFDVTLGP